MHDAMSPSVDLQPPSGDYEGFENGIAGIGTNGEDVGDETDFHGVAQANAFFALSRGGLAV